MPRQPCLELPSVPMLVVQRVVNWCAFFLGDEDWHHYCLYYVWPTSALLCGCMRLC